MNELITDKMRDATNAIMMRVHPSMKLSGDERKAMIAAHVKEHAEKFSAMLTAAWDANEQERNAQLEKFRTYMRLNKI